MVATHAFTDKIKNILQKKFGKQADLIFKLSPLLQYLNFKTRAASKGAKARRSLANNYAIYVLVEDYINNKFHEKGNYKKYEGASFTNLLAQVRKLPFGEKFQNHALNSRCNEEFQKFFPSIQEKPIIRDLSTKKYWINEKLMFVEANGEKYFIGGVIVEIIDEYVQVIKSEFEKFIHQLEQLKTIKPDEEDKAINFVMESLQPNVDARTFEIVSYAILKYYYFNQVIYWGYEKVLEKLKEEKITLYKTGRTNANDGGIDFVMKPLGRFFQVTETLDFKKYFLDIDKIQRFPITFVIKSTDKEDAIRKTIEDNATATYLIDAIVKTYMDCIEEIINIPILHERFKEAINNGFLKEILQEIIIQSRLEFNLTDSLNDEDYDDDGDDENDDFELNEPKPQYKRAAIRRPLK